MKILHDIPGDSAGESRTAKSAWSPPGGDPDRPQRRLPMCLLRVGSDERALPDNQEMSTVGSGGSTPAGQACRGYEANTAARNRMAHGECRPRQRPLRARSIDYENEFSDRAPFFEFLQSLRRGDERKRLLDVRPHFL